LFWVLVLAIMYLVKENLLLAVSLAIDLYLLEQAVLWCLYILL
jgi:hypothetical protein